MHRTLLVTLAVACAACTLPSSDPEVGTESEAMTKGKVFATLGAAGFDAAQAACLVRGVEVGPARGDQTRSADTALPMALGNDGMWRIGGCGPVDPTPREPNADLASLSSELGALVQDADALASLTVDLWTKTHGSNDQPQLEFSSGQPLEMNVELSFDGYEGAHGTTKVARLELESAAAAVATLSPSDFTNMTPAQRNAAFVMLANVTRVAAETSLRARATAALLHSDRGTWVRQWKTCWAIFIPYPCYDDVWVPAQ